MCGLVGFFDPTGINDQSEARRLVTDMSDKIAHRGPDDSGAWIDPAGLALGFRRLSIVDVSASGHQPMLSADGRYVIVVNGEIYNFAELRTQVSAAAGVTRWRGHSDTEVLAEGISVWGVEAAVSRANGMFALAAWDRQDRVLWLARDRIGKKPLHYGWVGGSFVFGSELKALWPYPGFDFSVCPDALASFLQLGYVPAPRTIFRAVAKLEPGHILRLDARAASQRDTPAPKPYWTLATVAKSGLEDQRTGRTATTEELEALLRNAVALRMVADVPVGAFLSGGIDSSLVTAVMAAQTPAAVCSFAIGFGADKWNEARHARAVATHLGTHHTEMYVNSAEAMAVIDDVAAIYDEPFADASMIPTTLVSRLARQSVTVALSGDGGDELFGGYRRYGLVQQWLARRAAIPSFALPVAQKLLANVAEPAARAWGSLRFQRHLGLLGPLLDPGQPESFNEAMMSQVIDPASLMAHRGAPCHPLLGEAYRLGQSTTLDRLTFMDTKSYLVDDILAKVDRASMSTSLEVRCPLLDHRVIEMSWRFPSAAKLAGGAGKLPLRDILYRYVPRALVDRPKMGFGAPVQLWLRDGMRDWAEALMSRQALGQHGLLNVEACRRLWEAFTVRGRGWNNAIWNVLMFQAWHARMSAVSGASGPRLPAPKAASPHTLEPSGRVAEPVLSRVRSI